MNIQVTSALGVMVWKFLSEFLVCFFLFSVVATSSTAGEAGHGLGMSAWETYEYGKSLLRRRPVTAAKYLARAAEMGNNWAAYDLAELYRAGEGVPKDISEAVRLYESIVDSNFWAQYQLGEMLRTGEGVTQDFVRARQLLESAVVGTDDQWPKYALAQLLEASDDESDVRRAIGLYREASYDGNSYARQKHKELCRRIDCRSVSVASEKGGRVMAANAEADVPGVGSETSLGRVSEPAVAIGCAEGELVLLDFAIGSAEVPLEKRGAVEAFLANAGNGCAFEVTGYSSLGGPADLNEQIATARAEEVARLLVEKGVSEEHISTLGAGPTSAFGVPAENRRVVIIAVP